MLNYSHDREPRREETAWRDPLALTAAGRCLKVNSLVESPRSLQPNGLIPTWDCPSPSPNSPIIRSTRHLPPTLRLAAPRPNATFSFFIFFSAQFLFICIHSPCFYLLKRNTVQSAELMPYCPACESRVFPSCCAFNIRCSYTQPHQWVVGLDGFEREREEERKRSNGGLYLV